MVGAGDALHLVECVVEFDGGHGLAAEDAEGLHLEGGEAAGVLVEHEERADADAGGCNEWGASVEAEAAAGERDAIGSEGGMGTRVGNLIDKVGAHGFCAGEGAERQLSLVDAVARVDVDAVDCGEGDACGGGVAGAGGQLGEVFDCGVRRDAGYPVAVEAFETQNVRARDFAFHQGGTHGTPQW